MVPPADGSVTRDGGPPATALVVIEEQPSVGEGIEAGEEVVVVRPWTSVEHYGRRT